MYNNINMKKYLEFLKYIFILFYITFSLIWIVHIINESYENTRYKLSYLVFCLSMDSMNTIMIIYTLLYDKIKNYSSLIKIGFAISLFISIVSNFLICNQINFNMYNNILYYTYIAFCIITMSILSYNYDYNVENDDIEFDYSLLF